MCLLSFTTQGRIPIGSYSKCISLRCDCCYRFLKGAVDSEDLPLSLSREKPQNSALLRRIKDVLTRKFLRFLSDEAKNNPESYREFYVEYHMFLKEGLCQDYAFTESLSKLLLFESSAADAGQVISLDDYISRCPPEQKHIYYLVAPSREAALQSPYYETFRKHKKEVVFLYNTIDDFVMSNINTFAGTHCYI
jgi:TNF receptor-associated protein 1